MLAMSSTTSQGVYSMMVSGIGWAACEKHDEPDELPVSPCIAPVIQPAGDGPREGRGKFVLLYGFTDVDAAFGRLLAGLPRRQIDHKENQLRLRLKLLVRREEIPRLGEEFSIPDRGDDDHKARAFEARLRRLQHSQIFGKRVDLPFCEAFGDALRDPSRLAVASGVKDFHIRASRGAAAASDNEIARVCRHPVSP